MDTFVVRIRRLSQSEFGPRGVVDEVAVGFSTTFSSSEELLMILPGNACEGARQQPVAASSAPVQRRTEMGLCLLGAWLITRVSAAVAGVSCSLRRRWLGSSVGRRWLRTCIGIAFSAGLAFGAVVVTPSAAEALVPVWPAASGFTTLPPGAQAVDNATLNSVACTGPGDCVVVGEYADGNGTSTTRDQAMVATETSGVWGQASELVLPAGALMTGDQEATLESVACTGTGDCVAVGGYIDTNGDEQAMVAAETGGVWGQASRLTLPSDASDKGGFLESVACTGTGDCVAVGYYWDTNDGGEYQAMVATETSGVWGQASRLTLPADASTPSSIASLESVACTGPGDCVAVGYYTDTNATTPDYQAMVATDTDGVWGQASRLTLPADATTTTTAGLQYTSMDSVSCTSSGDCVAVGYYNDADTVDSGSGQYRAMVATETGGVWGQASQLTLPADATTTPSDQAAVLDSVTCASPGNCVAVGGYTDTNGDEQAMTAAETGGVWGQGSKLTLPADAATTPGDQDAGLGSVACTGPGSCTAVGGYQNVDYEQAMVVSSMAASLAVSTASLPPGVVGSAYTTQLAATGGTGSDTWSVSSGSLAAGLTLNASTGVISGTPTAAGTTSFTVTVSDMGSPAQHASAALSIIVSPLSQSPPPKQPPPTKQLTRSTRSTVGNQEITLITPALTGCVRNTAKLAVMFTSTTVPRSKQAKLKFSRVAFSIDKGVKHIHHKTVHTHSAKKTITVIVYTANMTAHHVPVSLNLSLTSLKAGTHTLSAVVSYTTIKRIHAHKRKVTLTTTVKSKFTVC